MFRKRYIQKTISNFKKSLPGVNGFTEHEYGVVCWMLCSTKLICMKWNDEHIQVKAKIFSNFMTFLVDDPTKSLYQIHTSMI